MKLFQGISSDKPFKSSKRHCIVKDLILYYVYFDSFFKLKDFFFVFSFCDGFLLIFQISRFFIVLITANPHYFLPNLTNLPKFAKLLIYGNFPCSLIDLINICDQNLLRTKINMLKSKREKTDRAQTAHPICIPTNQSLSYHSFIIYDFIKNRVETWTFRIE